jgi:hypothetical protein
MKISIPFGVARVAREDTCYLAGRASRPPYPSVLVARVIAGGVLDASFVPALSDFERLDSRIRLRDSVWKQLPMDCDCGFAVFQLRAGNSRIHPMASSFKTRSPRALFFPTAHVHDGEDPCFLVR